MLGLVIWSPAKATAPEIVVPVWSREDPKPLIFYYADKYQVSREKMDKIVFCESQYIETAVGDHGHSFGLAQLNNPASKGVTIEQANDPDFALDYMAKHLRNHTDRWSCEHLI